MYYTVDYYKLFIHTEMANQLPPLPKLPESSVFGPSIFPSSGVPSFPRNAGPSNNLPLFSTPSTSLNKAFNVADYVPIFSKPSTEDFKTPMSSPPIVPLPVPEPMCCVPCSSLPENIRRDAKQVRFEDLPQRPSVQPLATSSRQFAREPSVRREEVVPPEPVALPSRTSLRSGSNVDPLGGLRIQKKSFDKALTESTRQPPVIVPVEPNRMSLFDETSEVSRVLDYYTFIVSGQQKIGIYDYRTSTLNIYLDRVIQEYIPENQVMRVLERYGTNVQLETTDPRLLCKIVSSTTKQQLLSIFDTYYDEIKKLPVFCFIK